MGLPQQRAQEKMTESSLIQHGRPAEHHLLPKKLFIKSQLSFCKHFIENKICKLISCEARRRHEEEERRGRGCSGIGELMIIPGFAADNLKTKGSVSLPLNCASHPLVFTS